ncbi:hypothetical protein E3P99_02933 [Wallemia hederae]|uniref:Uncharacterized protein n=1 Tax=Wallemia hederae TaxID=1540922 RepID=A0A4T0FI46_9BASI|nr:hypothetical protein E3P99_02933 [Wallemia hederae]
MVSSAMLDNYVNLLSTKSDAFVNGDGELQQSSLLASKELFDRGLKNEKNDYRYINEFLKTCGIPAAVDTRTQTKRKRGGEDEEQTMQIEETPLDELFVDGFNDDQIYHQLDLRAQTMCDLVERLVDAANPAEQMASEPGSDEEGIEDEEEEEEEDIDLENLSPEEIEALRAEGLLDEGDSDGGSYDDYDEESQEEDEDDDDDDPTIGEISYQKLNDHDNEESSDEEQDEITNGAKKGGKKQPQPKKDVWGLDDAFFSIDDFNRLTEDQEVNERLRRRSGDDDSDSEEEEDVDIFSAEAAAQLENDDENANDVFFNDFFAPPRRGWSHAKPTSYSLAEPKDDKKAKKDKQDKKDKKEKKDKRRSSVRFDDSVKVQKIKNKSRGSMRDDDDDDSDEDEDEEGVTSDAIDLEDADLDMLDEDALGEKIGGDEDEDEEMEDDEEGEEGAEDEDEDDDAEAGSEIGDGQQTMENFNSDLFAEEEEDNDDDEAPASAHGRRRAALARQIADLEDENVAAKEWTLKGEVTSKARPENSLLAEDLDFETINKITPENTEEKQSTLEDLIKRRIINEQFNDVEKVTQVNEKPFLPSRLFELSDQQSQQGLGDLYANEYSGNTVNVDDKLAKEHKEIDEMWNQLSSKLDALSNAHFTPPAPKAQIETVSNTPSISLENALPTAQSTSSQAAPEEVYSGSKFGNVSKDEMTPEEKRAQRAKIRKSRAKDRAKIAHVVDDKSRKKSMSVGDEKREALKKLTQGKGVTVVGKGDANASKKKKKGNSEQGKNASGLKL